MMELIKYNPLSRRSPFRDLERWFFSPSFYSRFDDEDRSYMPKVDVVEDEKEYKVMADIPGYSREDVKVEFEDGRLSIRAEHKEEKEENKGNYHLRERKWGSFCRSFVLPNDADPEKIAAAVKEGILTVTIPRSEAKQPRQIEVQVH